MSLAPTEPYPRLRPLDRVRLRGDIACGTVYASWPDLGWPGAPQVVSVRLDDGTVRSSFADRWLLLATEHGGVANPSPDNTIQQLLNFE